MHCVCMCSSELTCIFYWHFIMLYYLLSLQSALAFVWFCLCVWCCWSCSPPAAAYALAGTYHDWPLAFPAGLGLLGKGELFVAPSPEDRLTRLTGFSTQPGTGRGLLPGTYPTQALVYVRASKHGSFFVDDVVARLSFHSKQYIICRSSTVLCRSRATNSASKNGIVTNKINTT